MKDYAFPFFAGLGVIFALLPLTWHFRSKNYSVLFLLSWVAIWNCVLFINSLIWFSTTEAKCLVWCDISGKIIQMANFAVPAATLCIARKLESIASTRQVASTDDELRRRALFDLILCVALPLIFGVLTIVYQGHRADIYEGVGCFIPVYFSWPYIAFGLVPCLLVSFVSLGYSALSMRWFLLRRRQFAAVLSSSGSNMNRVRYLRMICFCAVDMVVTIPITVGLMTAALVDSNGKLEPYTSWAAVHYQFGTVLQITASELDMFSVQRSRIDLGRWVAPISAFLFFVILGLTHEARSEYRRLASAAWRWGNKKPKERPAILVQVQRSTLTDSGLSDAEASVEAKSFEMHLK